MSSEDGLAASAPDAKDSLRKNFNHHLAFGVQSELLLVLAKPIPREMRLSISKFPRRACRFPCFAVCVLIWLLGATQLRANEVDLELVLAVDISGSMDARERAVQRGGYVEAFRHRDVVRAIRGGMIGRISVTYVEWAGAGFQAVVVPWTVIGDAASANQFADTLEAAPTNDFHGTSISEALTFSARQFDLSNHNGIRQVIDISGDGPNNRGPPVLEARSEVLENGITINGLPIVIGKAGGSLPTALLDIYYEDCVIGGPGAFMIAVDDIDRWSEAIRRKLVLEIAGRPARVIAAAMPSNRRIDCLIGEKLRRNWYDDP